MIVTYRKLASGQWAPEFPERAAKDAMGQVHQSPAKSPRLWPHFYGEKWKPLLLLSPSPFPSPPQMGGWGVWRDGRRANTLSMPYRLVQVLGGVTWKFVKAGWSLRAPLEKNDNVNPDWKLGFRYGEVETKLHAFCGVLTWGMHGQKGIYIYIIIYICVCTYIPTYLHTYIHRYIHTYMYMYTYIRQRLFNISANSPRAGVSSSMLHFTHLQHVRYYHIEISTWMVKSG